jgi:hypothetical protein
MTKTTNKCKNTEMRVKNVGIKYMELNNIEKLEIHKINKYMKKRGNSF